MSVNLELNYNGNTLPVEITQQLIDYVKNELNVPPSYLITKLHYEGLWGGSGTAQNNNNWGGMTWVSSWSTPYKRDSGVTVTRGTSRPANEGGYYINYESVFDFLKDWSYLIRLGGSYNVANSDNFNEAVKGMFRYGGSRCDYAMMSYLGGNGCSDGNSKNRYIEYLAGMEARRNAINNANDGVLDILDNEDHSSDPNNNPDIGNKEFEDSRTKVEKEVMILRDDVFDFKDDVEGLISNIFSNLVFDYGNSYVKGNSYINVEKVFDGVYKIMGTINIKNKQDNFEEKVVDKVDDHVKIVEKEVQNDDNSIPKDGKKSPAFPSKQPYRITDTYRFRNQHPVTGLPVWHNGVDFADMVPGTSVPIYATQDGIVSYMNNDPTNSAGYYMAIEHTGDPYHSVYMHMAGPPLPALNDVIKKGEQIGMTGATGGVTGVHLHFGISTVRNVFNDHNVTIDPMDYLKMKF